MPKLNVTNRENVAEIIGEKAAELFNILDTVNEEAVAAALAEGMEPLDIVSAVMSAASTQLHTLTGSTTTTGKVLIESGELLLGSRPSSDVLAVVAKRLATIEAVANGKIHANMSVIAGLARDARDIVGYHRGGEDV